MNILKVMCLALAGIWGEVGRTRIKTKITTETRALSQKKEGKHDGVMPF